MTKGCLQHFWDTRLKKDTKAEINILISGDCVTLGKGLKTRTILLSMTSQFVFGFLVIMDFQDNLHGNPANPFRCFCETGRKKMI